LNCRLLLLPLPLLLPLLLPWWMMQLRRPFVSV
jgi:hypothetical protein